MHLYTTTYRSQWFSDMASIAAAGIETSFSFLTQKQHSPCISITNLRCQTLRIHPQSSYSPAAATLLQASPDKNTNNVLLSGRRNRSGTLPPAAVRHLVGSLVKAEGLRFAIVVARFNEVVTKLLMEGALETFKRYSVREEDIDVVWVPGSFEIPIVAERLGKLGKYQAVLCIGAVVRGDTTHYDAVANSAASGVLSAGLNSGVPCIFGVLTCDDMDQALNRAGGKAGNKGSEAALTAIEMASLFQLHLTEKL